MENETEHTQPTQAEQPASNNKGMIQAIALLLLIALISIGIWIARGKP